MLSPPLSSAHQGRQALSPPANDAGATAGAAPQHIPPPHGAAALRHRSLPMSPTQNATGLQQLTPLAEHHLSTMSAVPAARCCSTAVTCHHQPRAHRTGRHSPAGDCCVIVLCFHLTPQLGLVTAQLCGDGLALCRPQVLLSTEWQTCSAVAAMCWSRRS